MKVPFTTENVIFDPNSSHLFDGSSVRPNTVCFGHRTSKFHLKQIHLRSKTFLLSSTLMMNIVALHCAALLEDVVTQCLMAFLKSVL